MDFKKRAFFSINTAIFGEIKLFWNSIFYVEDCANAISSLTKITPPSYPHLG